MRAVFAAACMLLALTVSAASAPKLALVIGNADYRSVGMLKNPVADADLISATLRQIGFDVTDKRNLGSTALRAAIIDFLKKADAAGPGATLVLYYSGHGAQIGRENYLIPVDLKPASSVTLEAFGLSDYMENVPSRVAASIIILDACRDNPIATKTKGGTRGLTLVSETGNVPTYIMFSAAPGKTAEDGDGDHSPFSEALADNLTVPGLSIEVVGRRVRGAVFAATDQRQDPWANSNLKQAVVLAPGDAAAQTAAAPPPARPAATPPSATRTPAPPSDAALELAYFDALRKNTFEAYHALLDRYPDHPRKKEILGAIQRLTDEQMWTSVEAHPSLGGYRQYMASFPNGIYFEVAKRKIEELSRGSDEAYCRSAGNLAEARSAGRDALVAFRDRCRGVSGGLALRADDDIRDLDQGGKTFAFQRGIDFDGDDIGPYLYDRSLNSCTDACRADSRCNAFTYNTRLSVCILKSGYGTPRRNDNAISAAIRGLSIPPPQAGMRIESDRDYPHGDMDPDGIRPVTLQECSRLCLGESDCRAFSYARKLRWCWLKDRVYPGRHKRGVTSGLKLDAR